MTCLSCKTTLEPEWRTSVFEYDDPPLRAENYTCGNCGVELGIAMTRFRRRPKRKREELQPKTNAPETQTQ
jgi:hypothetical protein